MRFIPFDQLPAFQAALAVRIRDGSIVLRRDSLAIALGLCGLRAGEVTKASIGDLFVPGRQLNVATLKKGKPRVVPLHPTLVDALVAWRADAGGSQREPLLFTSTGERIQRSHLERFARSITREALGEPLKFHALRHTFAMSLYAATRDLFLVQQQLGHRSVTSTEVYARSLARVPESCLVSLI